MATSLLQQPYSGKQQYKGQDLLLRIWCNIDTHSIGARAVSSICFRDVRKSINERESDSGSAGVTGEDALHLLLHPSLPFLTQLISRLY